MNEILNLRWRKSSRSGNQGQCVEVATADSTWYVRDSKNPDAGHLTVSPTAWHAFLDTITGTSTPNR